LSQNTSAHHDDDDDDDDDDVAPSIESLSKKTGKQIAEWVQMSCNHVFHSRLKYTILSPSGREMSLV